MSYIVCCQCKLSDSKTYDSIEDLKLLPLSSITLFPRESKEFSDDHE